MKRKIFMVVMALALAAALLLPAMASANRAEAWGIVWPTPVAASNTVELSFVGNELVSPQNQRFDVFNDGTGVLFYSVTSNQSWLTVFPAIGMLNPGVHYSPWAIVNSVGKTVDDHTATLAVRNGWGAGAPAQDYITVNLEVQPGKINPLMLGMDNPFQAGDQFGGFALNVKSGPTGLLDMDTCAITLGNGMSMTMTKEYSYEVPDVNGDPTTRWAIAGTLNLPSGEVYEFAPDYPGGVLSYIEPIGGLLGAILPEGYPEPENCWIIHLGGVTVQTDPIFGGEIITPFPQDQWYRGMLLEDMAGMIDVLPMLMTALTEAGMFESDWDGFNGQMGNAGSLPMAPLIALVGGLMPLVQNILSNDFIMGLLSAIASLIPSCLILMPDGTWLEMSGLMLG